MATATRTDIHRPSAAVYGDYEYLTDFYQGASDEVWKAYKFENKAHTDLLEAGPRFNGNFSNKGTCDHCGAVFSYGVCFRHRSTRELVNIGHICAYTFLSREQRRVIDQKHARALKAEERAREQAKFLAENDGAAEAIEYLRANDGNPFYASLLQSFRDHYKLTPKQLAAAINAKARDEEKARERAAKAEAKAAVAQEVPDTTERIEITGTVISVKEEVDEFASTRYYTAYATKLLVEDDRGFRVYGTCPRALEYTSDDQGIAKGARVAFKATVKRSAKDPFFGYYSRPTQPKFL